MRLFPSKYDTGRADELWPVLLLLLVVAVPTLGVLWFVGIAVENQQLAAKQRLAEAYQSHLLSIRSRIMDDWREIDAKVESVMDTGDETTPREIFQEVVSGTSVDAVVCLDAEGGIAYPGPDEVLADTQAVPVVPDPRWKEAEWIENVDENLVEAERVFQSIAADARNQRDKALAIQGQVRCLLKSFKKDAAIKLVVEALDETAMGPIKDKFALQAIANIELMAIEHSQGRPEFQQIWNRLHQRIFADTNSSLSGSQRLFVMRRMTEIHPRAEDIRLLKGEDVAARLVEDEGPSSELASPTLRRTKVPDFWSRATKNGRVALAFKTDTVRAWAQDAAGGESKVAVEVDLLPPAESPANSPENANVVLPMGDAMPGWRLWLSHRDDAGVTSDLQSTRIQIWIASLVVLFTSILGIAIARAIQHKLRVANLKNDLVGTVSHELKTPLASMRLLVETLLNEEKFDENNTRDYLKLIDKENVRLSRLIENFLTFSRMEKNRHAFDFDEVAVADVIAEAIDAMADRLRGPSCKLEVNVPQDLPRVWADRDGLVTVFLNLLDNAVKYSGDEPDIRVSARHQGDEICVTVSDNGIGLPRTATRRIFERFFQVDQSLVRQGQGCGLGLSIVDFIVRAHHGDVTVNSKLGSGSTFAVSLPIDRNSRENDAESVGIAR